MPRGGIPKYGKRMEVFSARILPEDLQALKAFAKEQGIGWGQLGREVVSEYVKRRSAS